MREGTKKRRRGMGGEGTSFSISQYRSSSCMGRAGECLINELEKNGSRPPLIEQYSIPHLSHSLGNRHVENGCLGTES